MNTTQRIDDAPLDSFEESLLHELKQVVAQQPAPARMPRRRPVWQRPAVRLAAAATAVAAGVAGYLATPLGTSPAFAVTSEPNGDVTVSVDRLEGAEALEDALAAKGIRADVTYPAAGRQCQAGRYTDVPPAGGRLRMSASTGQNGQTLTIPRNALGPGQTLVLESMWPQGEQWAMHVGVAQGAVAPCVEEDFRLPDGMPHPGDVVPPGGSPTTQVYPPPS